MCGSAWLSIASELPAPSRPLSTSSDDTANRAADSTTCSGISRPTLGPIAIHEGDLEGAAVRLAPREHARVGTAVQEIVEQSGRLLMRRRDHGETAIVMLAAHRRGITHVAPGRRILA